MRNHGFILTVLAVCLLTVTACGKDNGGPISNKQAIDIAARHLIGKSFDNAPPSTVTFADGKYTVSFKNRVPGGAPGETYTTRVVFDAKTKEALEIEMLTE